MKGDSTRRVVFLALVMAVCFVWSATAQSTARGRGRGPSTARVELSVPLSMQASGFRDAISVFVDGDLLNLPADVPAGQHRFQIRSGPLATEVSLSLQAGTTYTLVPNFSVAVNLGEGRVAQPVQPTPRPSPGSDRGQNQGSNSASEGNDRSPGRFGPLRYGWYEIMPGMIGMAADYEYLRFSPDGSVMYRSGTDPQPVPRGYYEWDGTILRHYDGPNDSRPREWRRVGPTEFESLDSNPDLGPDRLEFEQ